MENVVVFLYVIFFLVVMLLAIHAENWRCVFVAAAVVLVASLGVAVYQGEFERTTVYKTETVELEAFPDDADGEVYVKLTEDGRCEVAGKREGGLIEKRALPSEACTVNEVEGGFRMEVYRKYEVLEMNLCLLDLLEPNEVVYRLYVPEGTAGQLTDLQGRGA